MRTPQRRSNYERRVAVPGRRQLVQDVHLTPIATQSLSLPALPLQKRATFPSIATLRPVKSISSVDSVRISDIRPYRTLKPAPLSQSLLATNDLQPDLLGQKNTATRHQSSPNLPTRQMRSTVLHRAGVRATHPGVKRFRYQVRPLMGTAMTALAVLVIVAGLLIGYQGYTANKTIATTVDKISTQQNKNSTAPTPDVPTEHAPVNVASYKVAADMPRIITIPKFNVQARILKMGIKANNQLAAPGNIFDAGWYEASAKPGTAGATLLDGHVSGPTKRGVFYDLKKLVAGDQIQIERGDGKQLTYKVVALKQYDVDAVDMAAALTPVHSGKNGLNLITCDGTIDESGTHYKQRLVVFAVQV